MGKGKSETGKKRGHVGEPLVMLACKGVAAKLESIGLRGRQGKTCDAAGIPHDSISRWRGGPNNPPTKVYLDHAFLLARHLGISLDWLADDAITGPPGAGPATSEMMRRILDVVEEIGERAALDRLLLKPQRLDAETMTPATTRPKDVPERSRKRRAKG